MIGLFGLSANPPTGLGGHQGIIRSMVRSGKYSEIWILPVYSHMYSAKRSLQPFAHRLQMCRLAFEDERSESTSVFVLPLEQEVWLHYNSGIDIFDPSANIFRVGTVDLLDYLKSNMPSQQFTFILGEDSYGDLCSGKWKQSDRILQLVDIHVFSRKGFEPKRVPTNSERTITFEDSSFLSNISSSQIREGKLWSVEAAATPEVIHPDVADYIRKESLFEDIS